MLCVRQRMYDKVIMKAVLITSVSEVSVLCKTLMLLQKVVTMLSSFPHARH